MQTSTQAGALHASTVPGFWENVAGLCDGLMSAAWQTWRGTTVLALGESFGDEAGTAKSAQVVQRLRRLNPALRVRSRCAPAMGLLEAAAQARGHARRSFDAAIVFIGQSELERLESRENFAEAAEQALLDIGRAARRVFVVTAFDSDGRAGPERGIAARRRRWLERLLGELCTKHRFDWVPLAEEEGCVAAASMASFNFSVDGFRPEHDPHEMWTARMLQQPALAQLVFH